MNVVNLLNRGTVSTTIPLYFFGDKMDITNVDAFKSNYGLKKKKKQKVKIRTLKKSSGFSHGIANAPIRKKVR